MASIAIMDMETCQDLDRQALASHLGGRGRVKVKAKPASFDRRLIGITMQGAALGAGAVAASAVAAGATYVTLGAVLAGATGGAALGLLAGAALLKKYGGR